MSLGAEVWVNRRRVGAIVVQRKTNLDGAHALDEDTVSEYSVYVRDGDGITNTTVRHRYGDGALALLHRAVGQALEVRAGLQPKLDP